MFDEETEKQAYSLVEQSVENENFRKYVISLQSRWNRGAVEFIRVGIFGRDHNNFHKNLDLIIKVINIEKALKMSILKSLKRGFRREIFIYDKVFFVMERFQRQNRGAKYPFELTQALCYKTLETNDGELAVIFNDLKKLEFRHLDPRRPMDIFHIKAVLQQYARFHAMCFALRYHSDFEKLRLEFDPVDKETFSERKLINKIERGIARAIGALSERKQYELKHKFMKFVEKGIGRIFGDVLSNVPDEWVFLHGDGWNENFVFRYKDDEKKLLPDTCILNWQFSTPHSPAVDLSLFLYSVSSKEELQHFDGLITFYYDHFCLVLSSLNRDPHKVFPLSTLMLHWRTFSAYALLLVVAGLPDICARQPGTLSLIPEEDYYNDRITAVIEHYFNLVNA